MPFTNPRLTSLNTVTQCLMAGRDLQEVLDYGLSSLEDQRDRAFATELTYGFMRYKGRLDFLVNSFLEKPDGLPNKLKFLLGLAGYELFFLDKVPHYAAISSAVDLCRDIWGERMSTLVNAVLRRMAELEMSEDLFRKDNPSQEIFWSRYYSCPLWLVRLWKKSYGRELCLEYLKQSLTRPPLGVREHRRFQGILDDENHILKRAGNSVLVKDDYPGIGLHIQEGRVYRQSFAGQMTMRLSGMDLWETPVWDMCAGSGGKTFLMLDQDIDVLSSDLHFKRLVNLKRISMSGGYNVKCFAAIGQEPPLNVQPGTVLIDAPCTGFGVLSRRPDIKWKRTQRDIEKLALIQAELIDGAAKILTPGGRIVYITCTLTKKENDTQVNDFLYRHKNFVLEKMLQTDPATGLNEFFFAAVFQKRQ